MATTVLALAMATFLAAEPGVASPPPPSPPAIEATPAELSRKRALAFRYMKAVDMENILPRFVDGLNRTIIGTLAQDNDKISEEVASAVADASDEAFREQMPTLMDHFADIYAEAFTEEELVKLAEFFEGPVGRKMTGMSAKLEQAGAAAMMKILPQYLEGVRERICHRLDCDQLNLRALDSAV